MNVLINRLTKEITDMFAHYQQKKLGNHIKKEQGFAFKKV